MKERDRELAAAIRQDAEDVPVQGLNPLRALVKQRGRHRLPALGDLLVKSPDDRATLQLYLETLFQRSQRQVGGQMTLFKTFVRMVDELDADVRAALPSGLFTLARLAKEAPIRCEQPDLLAHALTIEGRLTKYLRSHGWRGVLDVPEDADTEAVRRRYMKLRREAHPDHGGDPDMFRDIQQAWEQAQDELAA